jgi:hypothetical protein
MWRRKAMWRDEVAVERGGGRGENGYLDTQMRNGIRIVLNQLLEEEREGLAR